MSQAQFAAAFGFGLDAVAFGAALLITPFACGAAWPATVASLACGAALIVWSVRRGPIRNSYGGWGKVIV